MNTKAKPAQSHHRVGRFLRIITAWLTPRGLLEQDINALYLSILGRTADTAALAAVVTAVRRGVSWVDITTGLANSEEYAAAALRKRQVSEVLIGSLFRTGLGREADEGDLNGFGGQLASGVPVDAVISAIVSSPEFHRQCGAGAVTDMGGGADSNVMAVGYGLISEHLARRGISVYSAPLSEMPQGIASGSRAAAMMKTLAMLLAKNDDAINASEAPPSPRSAERSPTKSVSRSPRPVSRVASRRGRPSAE